MSIEKLVNLSKLGNRESITYLVERLKPIRLALVSKFYWLDREDLDQDLILVLLECIDSYKEGSCSFQWYVREMSRFYCLDKAKKEDRCLSLDEVDDKGCSFLENLSNGIFLEDVVLDREFEGRVDQAIRELEPRLRFVICFYYFRGWGLKEIGNKLCISVSSVSKLKKKGERELRRRLK